MSGTGRRAGGARGLAVSRAWPGILACLVLALAAGGCANAPAPNASLTTDRGASIAFESIDGPPVAVFQNLVTTLSAEAAARRVRVVSRTGDPAYRIRGYLAAIVVGGKSHISWVWDVYDADKRRVFRIAGEEAGGRANAWGAADEQLVRRIARTSMDRLVAFLAAPSAPPAGEPPPQPGQPAIASGEGVGPAPTLALAR